MAQYSGHYLLDLLSEEDQQKFKLNYELDYQEFLSGVYPIHKLQTFEEYLDSKYPEFGDFIGSAFDWDNTKEGFEYWEEIAKIEII